MQRNPLFKEIHYLKKSITWHFFNLVKWIKN